MSMAAQEQEFGAVLPRATTFEDVNDVPKEVSDPGYGFNRFTSDSTVASLNGTYLWSGGIIASSGMDWQELHAVDERADGVEALTTQWQASKEGLTDEHPCVHFLDDEALPLPSWTGGPYGDALTDQAALQRALAIIEATSRSIREHASLEVSLEVALEFDQAWKSNFNDRLRPLREASALLARALADAVPPQYVSEDGDLVYLKADHLDKIAESLFLAM